MTFPKPRKSSGAQPSISETQHTEIDTALDLVDSIFRHYNKDDAQLAQCFEDETAYVRQYAENSTNSTRAAVNTSIREKHQFLKYLMAYSEYLQSPETSQRARQWNQEIIYSPYPRIALNDARKKLTEMSWSQLDELKDTGLVHYVQGENQSFQRYSPLATAVDAIIDEITLVSKDMRQTVSVAHTYDLLKKSSLTAAIDPTDSMVPSQDLADPEEEGT